MIADRTFGWQKWREFIPASHFLNGIYDRKTGEEINGPLPLSRSKLYACLKSLQSVGAIVAETVAGRVRYAIDLEWLMSLKTPKRLKAQQAPGAFTRDAEDRGPQEVVHTVDTPPRHRFRAVQDMDTQEGETPSGGISNREPCEAVTSPDVVRRSPVSVISDAVSAVSTLVSEAVARTNEKAAKRRATKLANGDPVEMHAAFAVAVKETWPEAIVAPLTDKQRGQLRHFAKSWQQEGLTSSKFISWSVQNWRRIYRAKFIYLADKVVYPEYPDLGFLMGYKKAFLDSYARRSELDRLAGLTKKDRLMKRLRFAGYSEEAAEREATEQLARDTRREDLDARQADLARQERLLKKEAEKLRERAIRPVQPVANAIQPYKAKVAMNVEDAPPVQRKTFEWRDDEAA